MSDESLDAGGTGSNESDLPVDITTLEVSGTRPSVGDKVDIQVSGTVSKIVNATAFVTPTQVNGAPLAESPMSTDEEDMRSMAMDADKDPMSGLLGG